MRIDQLTVTNFKGFDEGEFLFHPEFNLIVGKNGTGKSALLDALAVAAGSWFLGFKGCRPQSIPPEWVRLQAFPQSGGHSFSWEYQYPSSVTAIGDVDGQSITWTRKRKGPKGRTTSAEAAEINALATACDEQVRQGKPITLPLVSYYGTGRLHDVPRENAQVRSHKQVSKEKPSRLDGYSTSLDPRIKVSDLVNWMARQSWARFQKESDGALLDLVAESIWTNIDDAMGMYFDPGMGEVVLQFGEGGGSQLFNNLSDGQKCMLAMIGDIAQKAVRLNPHLEENALKDTPGVVLIDELDLHLHPEWQRGVIEGLRTTFPRMQFFCTTHSPFLIQSLRSGEELVILDGQPTANLGDLSVEEIAKGIQGVTRTETSQRYAEMKDVARTYLERLEEAEKAPPEKLEDYKRRLAEAIQPYADNPAFQAFLEMKRAAKLGE